MDRCHQSNVAHGTCLANGQLRLNFSHAEHQCVHLQTALGSSSSMWFFYFVALLPLNTSYASTKPSVASKLAFFRQ